MSTYKSFILFSKLIAWKVSDSWDGYDVGLFSVKRVRHPDNNKTKALRIVLWRLALWVQYT